MRRRRRRYYDPEPRRYFRTYDPDPDPFPFGLVVLAGMALAGVFGSVWLVREIKEPPDWMKDWRVFLGSPMGIVTVGLLAVCFLVGLAYALPKIKGALPKKIV